jgi:hypothetical protein
MLPNKQNVFQPGNACTGCYNMFCQSVDPMDTWNLYHDEQLTIMDTQTNTKIDFSELSTGICTGNYSFQLGEFICIIH